MKKQYKFIYYCSHCDSVIVLKSNQYLTDGEVRCQKCEKDIEFKDLIIKIIILDKNIDDELE